MEKFLRRVHLVYMFPSPTRIRFEKGRKADVLKDVFPVQRKHQISHRLISSPRRMLVVRQQNRRRNRHSYLAGQRVIKKLVICTPPEWIVNHDGPAQHGIFQIRPIKRNILRDAVNDHAISAGLRHLYSAQLHELSLHPINLHAVDAVHQSRWKGILHPKNNPNLLHKASFYRLPP